MENEEWKIVFDGTYEMSNLGNMRRAKPGISTFVGRPIHPTISAGGYLMAAVAMDGKQRRFTIHQLVMLAFVGERPEGMVINHKDFNRQNNRLENLEYITQKENMAHALGRKRHKGPTKEKAPLKGKQIGDSHWMRRMPEKILRGEQLKSKLTESQVMQIKERRKAGAKYREICEEFSISIAHVSRIILEKRWKHTS